MKELDESIIDRCLIIADISFIGISTFLRQKE